MSSEYKFNFNDLSRFMDDFFYLFQKGGRGNKFIISPETKSFIEKIIKWVVIIFQAMMIVVAIYVLYIIIFRGYPRIVVDLVTFKFYNKVKLDQFISERNLLINQFKFFTSPSKGCLTCFDLYKNLYQTTNLENNIKLFENQKEQFYAKYKYDDKYHNALKEYYLFYNKVDQIVPHDVWLNNNKITIQEYPFYELLCTYKLQLGEIEKNNTERGGKKGDDELIYTLYMKEKALNFPSLTAIKSIKATLNNIKQDVQSMITLFSALPLISYINIPNDDNAVNNVMRDISKFNKQIENGTIYNIEFSQINDNGWCLLEYFSYIQNPNQYDSFVKGIPVYTNEDINKIIYYLNLPRKSKGIAEKRIMTKNPEFYEYIKKRPIFSHIFFTQKQIDKQDLYKKVMNCYQWLSDCDGKATTKKIDVDILKTRISNLQKNTYTFKQLISSVAYLNLFLNEYQGDMTYMYEKQIISDKRFFRELWMPFLEDIMKNRVGTYFKKVFSSQGMGSSWTKFDKWYKQLGQDLSRMIKGVFKAFFTSTPIEQPQSVDTTDNGGGST